MEADVAAQAEHEAQYRAQQVGCRVFRREGWRPLRPDSSATIFDEEARAVSILEQESATILRSSDDQRRELDVVEPVAGMVREVELRAAG